MKDLNLNNMRQELWSSVHNLRAGTEKPAVANAISNSIGKIFTSVRMQMTYAKLTDRVPKIRLLAD